MRMADTDHVINMCKKSAEECDRHDMAREAELFRGVADDLDGLRPLLDG